jgi:ferredoxin
MSDSMYVRLQEHLDGLPVGFPKTPSGIEIAILKRIFQPDEAEMAVRLTPLPETTEEFSQRTGLDRVRAGEMLERMAKKGQIFRMRHEGTTLYNAAPFVPGIWEYQLENLDAELAGMVEAYFGHSLGKVISGGKIPIFRTLPVDENLTMEMEVMPYDRVKDIVRSQKTIALANCICRKERRLAGHECDHIDDVCLLFSHMARFYVENGLARFITPEEAVDVLDRAERDGLVHSPLNAQRPMGLCNCCGCCCGILRGITHFKLPPSKVIRSDFYSVCAKDACSGCGECVERCQVNAIQLVDEVARVDRSQCIGCGLCVSTCPTGALALVHKPPDEAPAPPATAGDVFKQLAMGKAWAVKAAKQGKA